MMPPSLVWRSIVARRAVAGATMCLAALAACQSAVEPAPDASASAAASLAHRPAAPVRPSAPVLEARTPRYPAIALYIVYREYLHHNPGLTTLDPDDRTYQNYVEKRMRELYPTRGYAGMMRDAALEARQNRSAWEWYEREMREYEREFAAYSAAQSLELNTASTCSTGLVDPYADADASWAGQDEYDVPPDQQLPTIQMEIDTLQLEPQEIEKIYYYESVAQGTYAPGGGGGDLELIESVQGQPSRDDLIRAAALGQTPYSDPGEVTIQVNPVEVGEALVALPMIGWKAYRVWQSVDRARQKSQQFYPHLAYDDTQRDAHRHILWNMMLRRYVGRYWADQIGDYHERNSVGAAHVMDLHNNDYATT